jgi:uncharacterized protein YjiS (DUF1127 family)
MSIVDIFVSASAPAQPGVLRRCREAFSGAVRHATEEWIVRRAVAELQALDDHMLQDIGLTRSEIESCVRHDRRNRYRD